MSTTARDTLTQQHDYQFLINFRPTLPPLLADEPAPLGTDRGPSPTELLLASVANCLSSSLLFALRKFKQDAGGIVTTATARIERNEEQRLRVQAIEVMIVLGKPAAGIDHIERIVSQFEAFCTVSQSVGRGIHIAVTVDDGDGVRLKG